MKSTTDEVRQVLMNELGLTRESVRQLSEQIVTKTVETYMSGLISSGGLDKIVEEAFRSQYRDPKNQYIGFSETLKQAAKEAADKFVRERVIIKEAP